VVDLRSWSLLLQRS